MKDAERLTKLEERYAHLQRHQTEQDKVMLGLADEVAKLRKEITKLRGQMVSSGEPGEQPDERPPHY